MTYKHYYIVAKRQIIIDNHNLIYQHECFKPGKFEVPANDDEVFVWAKFINEHVLEAWEKIAGVVPLPHPIESGNEPISDEHMEKLAPHIDIEVHPHPTDKGKKQFHCKRQNKLLTVNLHTREVAKRVAENRDPGFKFRVF